MRKSGLESRRSAGLVFSSLKVRRHILQVSIRGSDRMVSRIVEPILFGFLFVVLFWLSERNNNRERKVDRKKMRFWVAFSAWMTCVEFASAWHNEIGSAWQNHPDLSLFGTLVV